MEAFTFNTAELILLSAAGILYHSAYLLFRFVQSDTRSQ